MNLKKIIALTFCMICGITNVHAGKRELPNSSNEQAAKKLKSQSTTDSDCCDDESTDTNNNNEDPLESISATFKEDPLLLHIACSSGDLEMVNRLLSLVDGPAFLVKKDYADLTPLHHAALAATNAGEIITLLLAKADAYAIRHEMVSHVDDDGATPLMLALADDRHHEARLLIEAGSPLTTIDCAGKTVLHYAVSRENVDIIALLIAKGLHVDARDEENLTPLHYAIQDNNVEAVRVLINAGANVHDRLQSPLLEALDHGAYPVVKMLLEAGVSPDTALENCPRPLTILMSSMKSLNQDGQKEFKQTLATLKLLLAHGANILLPDNQNLMPLRYALDSDNTEIAQTVLLDSFIPYCPYDDELALTFELPLSLRKLSLKSHKARAACMKKSNAPFINFLNGHIERHFVLLKKLMGAYMASCTHTLFTTQIVKPFEDASVFSELPQELQERIRQNMLKRFLIPRRAL